MRSRLDGLRPGAQDLILLPEYANAPGLGEREAIRVFAARQGAVFLKAVAASARRLGCLAALAGLVQDGSRWFNRALVYDVQGDIVFHYDKVHLTDVERDEIGVTPGDGLEVFDHAGVRIGFATCFDMYFAEHFLTLAALNVDLVLSPSYQRSESAERLRVLAQARALDTGAYLVRSSYAMGDPAVGGRSLAATPAGMVLVDAGAEPGILAAELDPLAKFVKPASHGQALVEHRALIKAHRRPVVYKTAGNARAWTVSTGWMGLGKAKGEDLDGETG